MHIAYELFTCVVPSWVDDPLTGSFGALSSSESLIDPCSLNRGHARAICDLRSTIFRSRAFDRNGPETNRRAARAENREREGSTGRYGWRFSLSSFPPRSRRRPRGPRSEEGLRAYVLTAVHHADQARTVDLDFVVVV